MDARRSSRSFRSFGSVGGLTLLLSVLWALVTWSADQYIARVRVEDPEKGS